MATLAASWSTSPTTTTPTERPSDLARPMNPSQPHRQHSAPSSPSPPQPTVDVGYVHQPPHANNRQQPTSQSNQYSLPLNGAFTPPPQQTTPSAHWVPSPNAPPFVPQYPSYFAPAPQFHPHHPYYDPTQQQQQQQQHQHQHQQQQQQFAQWAYQQMIFNAQQQHFAAAANDYQRIRTPSGGSHRSSPQLTPQIPHPQQDFYSSHQAFNFTPSTTPPTQQQQQQQAISQQSQLNQQPQYQGFHPYRRPNASRQSSNRSNHQETSPAQNYSPHTPYVDTLHSGSSTSVNSGSGSSRRPSSPQQTSQTVHPHVTTPGSRQRTTSNRSSDRSSSQSVSAPTHARSDSANSGSTHRPSGAGSTSSSTSSNRPASPSTSSSATSQVSSPATTASSQRRPAKPSPLSQGSTTLTTAEERSARRISRDDSDLAYAASSLGGIASRSGGLKGRLRRALTLNNAGPIIESKPDASNPPPVKSPRFQNGKSKSTPALQASNELSGESSSPPHTPTSHPEPLPNTAPTSGRVKAKSLFNIKFNASTDNISLSSTVSSASVMIRKIGNMGKIARRSSIAGITRLFKDKDKTKKHRDEATSEDESSPATQKASRAEPTVSHATAEFDRGSFSPEDLKGLSPAARLARQHTLKSKAADAARAKTLAEQQMQHASADDDDTVPPTWERGTAKRNAQTSRPPIVMENGTHVHVEDEGDDSGSNSGSDEEEEDDDDMTLTREEQWNRQAQALVNNDQFDDDGDEDAGDEDVTIRLGSLEVHDDSSQDWSFEANELAIHQRDVLPAKGILRNANNYDQNSYLEGSANPHSALALQSRIRSNSYTAVNETGAPGALMRLPSPDPDHIDGLQKTEHHKSSSDSGHDLRLPDFSFEFNTSPLFNDSGNSSFDPAPNSERAIFNHPSMNSSAPVLSTINSPPSAPAHLTRTPARRITFAANLSIYDTFPATIYDRRCEPVTCNRLTPALAQRIKEELNTYKMEEMEVHSASRVHTHFFV